MKKRKFLRKTCINSKDQIPAIEQRDPTIQYEQMGQKSTSTKDFSSKESNKSPESVNQRHVKQKI